MVLRNSRQAGIKTREKEPDLQEKLTGIPESVQKFAVGEGTAGKLPASFIHYADSGTLRWAIHFNMKDGVWPVNPCIVAC